MATNYRGPSSPITIVAPAATVSGVPFLVAGMLVVPQTTNLISTDVAVEVEGVFEVASATSQAWTILALLYWDDTAKVLTTTSSGNTLVGRAAAVKLAASATGFVRLNPA